MLRHNSYCKMFLSEPGFEDEADCNCGAISPLRLDPSMSFEQAISRINLRKQNLDHILEVSERTKELRIREDELERVLEILSQVRP